MAAVLLEMADQMEGLMAAELLGWIVGPDGVPRLSMGPVRNSDALDAKLNILDARIDLAAKTAGRAKRRWRIVITLRSISRASARRRRVSRASRRPQPSYPAKAGYRKAKDGRQHVFSPKRPDKYLMVVPP